MATKRDLAIKKVMKFKWAKITTSLLYKIGSVLGVCVLLVICGVFTVDIVGFGVDSGGRVYVGMLSDIQVYENNTCIYEISTSDYRSYTFTITEEDTLLIATPNESKRYHLDGTPLDKSSTSGSGVYEKLWRKTDFTAADGHTYYLENAWGRNTIVRDDGVIVYKLPLLDFIVKMMLQIGFVGLFIAVPVVIAAINTAAGKLEEQDIELAPEQDTEIPRSVFDVEKPEFEWPWNYKK